MAKKADDSTELEQVQFSMQRRRAELQVRGGGPTPLAVSIREVIARRKIGRQLESLELTRIWQQAIAAEFHQKTRVLNLRNRLLLVEVSDSVLLSELVNFHQAQILNAIRNIRPDWQLKSIKFRLNGRLNQK